MTLDVGAVTSGAKLAVTREKLEYRQGSPSVVVKKFITQENVQLDVIGMEWNVRNLAIALGAGVTSATDSLETLEIGGSMQVDQYAARFVHVTPAGETVSIYLYTVEAAGALEVAFGEGPHEFPMSMTALETLTDWAGNTLAATKRLMKIHYAKMA